MVATTLQSKAEIIVVEIWADETGLDHISTSGFAMRASVAGELHGRIDELIESGLQCATPTPAPTTSLPTSAPVVQCANGIIDRSETDIDCGGICAPCDGLSCCRTNSDCANGLCVEGDDSMVDLRRCASRGVRGVCYTASPSASPTVPSAAPTEFNYPCWLVTTSNTPCVAAL